MNSIVLETTERGDVEVDVFAKLASDRILFLTGSLNDQIVTDLIATMIVKDTESNEPITLFINCEGGDIRAAFMLYDAIKMMSSPIQTVCVGMALNEAVFILAAGEPGNRLATPNAVIAPSQLSHNSSKYAALPEINDLMLRFKQDNKNMMTILAKCTGKTYQQVCKDFERQKFFSATQAAQYGIIDSVIKVD